MSEINLRLSKLRECMKKEAVDWYLIPTSDFHNSEYVSDHFKMREFFTGFTGSNGTLLVGMSKALLWTDGRYFIQCAAEIAGTEIEMMKMQEPGVPGIFEYIESNVKGSEVFGVDGRVITAEFGLKLAAILKQKQAILNCDLDLGDRVWENRPPMPSKPVRIFSEALFGKSLEEKKQEVMDLLAIKKVDSLFLARTEDIMWLLNIRGADVECCPVVLSYCFVTKDEIVLFVDRNKVGTEAEDYFSKHHITIKPYEEVFDYLKSYSFEGKVWIDTADTNYRIYNLLSKQAKIHTATNPTTMLKAVKNKTEQENLRRIYIKDSVAVCKFIYWIKHIAENQNITEYDAAMYMDKLRRDIPECFDLSFPTISAYQENAAMMHYEATKDCCKQIERRGLLLVDSGGQYEGGTTDVTRTIALGPVSDRIKEHYTRTAMGMLRLANAKFLEGCTGHNLDIYARGPLWEIGIDYKCGTGHGIGYMLNVHEGPQRISVRYQQGKAETYFEEGMLVSDEPGVYVEGSHGIRIENILLCKKMEKTADGQFLGFDTLTLVPLEREAIDIQYMQQSDIAMLNAYHKAVYETIAEYLEPEEKEWLKSVTSPF